MEEPLQLIQFLLRETFEEDGLLGLLGGGCLEVRSNINAPSVPARRLFAILGFKDLTRPLQGQPALPNQEQQHTFENLALEVRPQGLQHFVGQRKIHVHGLTILHSDSVPGLKARSSVTSPAKPEPPLRPGIRRHISHLPSRRQAPRGHRHQCPGGRHRRASTLRARCLG